MEPLVNLENTRQRYELYRKRKTREPRLSHPGKGKKGNGSRILNYYNKEPTPRKAMNGIQRKKRGDRRISPITHGKGKPTRWGKSTTHKRKKQRGDLRTTKKFGSERSNVYIWIRTGKRRGKIFEASKKRIRMKI